MPLVRNKYKLLKCGVCYSFILLNNIDYLLAIRANSLTNDLVIFVVEPDCLSIPLIMVWRYNNTTTTLTQ